MSALSRYIAAMRAGQLSIAYRIEQEYGLDGYPPQIVSAALSAIDRGDCPYQEIEKQMRPDTALEGKP